MIHLQSKSITLAVMTVCFLLNTAISAEREREESVRDPAAPRIKWTTSRIQGTPDPPDPYLTENAFPDVKFDEPLAIGVIPGTNRFVVAERHGKIYTFEDRPDATKELMMDLQRTIYGVAAHPQFVGNGQIFVTSIVKADAADGSRVSRFQVGQDGAFKADAESETVVFEWLSGGHNAGCIRFGPDGYLYLATGDGSGWADQKLTGQKIDDLLASILRIDVDHPADGRAYGIPGDNPFVNTPNARPEVYSYGHRQVWKFGFDQQGRLWAGDVGQDLWEMVYLVTKGGNHGWSVNEGSHPFRPEREQGPTPFVAPIVEHSHNDFRSITGGYFFNTAEPHELNGCYIYGDYDTGRIWSFRYTDNTVSDHRQLADTELRVVAFAQDRGGKVYVLDFVSGTLRHLVPAPPPPTDAPEFPRRLSETGLFTSTADYQPAAGLIPYSVIAPLWSDGAAKDRFIGLPGDSQIEFDAVTYPMPAPGWRFPDGTVLVKTFSMAMEAGNPATSRRLETRILHHKRMSGDDSEYGAQVWRGYTYVWNDEQTDAELLDSGGLDRELKIKDPVAPGGVRKLKWHFPSRAECTLCHTMSAKYVLGVNTMQMNHDYHYENVGTVNQLTMLEQLGVFTEPLPNPPDESPRLTDYHDQTADITDRARSYLHANCSHCHRVWGGGNADFQLQADLSLEETNTINAATVRGNYGLTDAAIIVPRHPERSVLLHRMQLLGLGRMPHVASGIVDDEGATIVRNWIRAMDVE